jgi:tetratricopeptide (TPR) repeat protein
MNKNDDNLALAEEKLVALEKAAILEVDIATKFKLEHEINELKQYIATLEEPIKKPVEIFETKKDQRIFYVPRVRNDYFTGRKEILKQLHEKLQQNQVVALNQKTQSSIAVHGLGGIGKTQTLIEYAYRCRKEGIYQAILWLSADSKESFELGFQTLAFELKIPIEGKPFEEIKKSVENWFLTHQDWLLLIDNADDLKIIGTFLSKVKGYGQILISTRAQSTRPFAEPLALEKMTELEAFEFLEKRTGLSIDDHAKELAKTLDYLPLALDQATAYLSETQMSFEDYLDIYQSDSVNLLNERGETLDKQDHPDPIAKTWLISFEKVQQKSELVITILKQCAFLSPDGIIEEIFKNIPKKAFNDALKEILSYSLLKRDAQLKRLSMHRLVQLVVRHQLSKEQQTTLATEVVKLVLKSRPNNETDFTVWLNRSNEWLLNAREAQHWIHEFQLQSADIGILLNNMGYFFEKIGDYQSALLLLKETLKITKEVLGSKHPNYATSLNNLASLYKTIGEHEKALSLHEEGLNVIKEVLGTRHPSYAVSLDNLASLYKTMGNYEQALPLFKEVKNILKETLGTQHPDYATSLNNLAGLFYSIGNNEKALFFYKKSLKIRIEILGSQHPDYAISLNNIASLYKSKEEYDKTLPLFAESLRILVTVLGEQHPNTQTIVVNYFGCLAASKGLTVEELVAQFNNTGELKKR